MYVDRLWRREREAVVKMVDAANTFLQAIADVNDFLDRSDITDVVDRDQRRAASLAIKQAHSGWDFWSRQVMALSAAIQAEEVARRLMGLDT